MTWFAIYTKPGSEDLVAQQLHNAEIETLTPKVMVIKYRRKKYTQVIEHLFPCYIFASFEYLTHGHMIKYTRGVKFIVGKEKPLAVNPEIIEALRMRMKGEMIAPEEEIIRRGERVIIKEGPFKDFQGVFERGIQGKERVMLLIEAIHGRIEIDR